MSDVGPQNNAMAPIPKTALEQLREIRETQLKTVDEITRQFKIANDELKRLDKAIKQWEPKE